MKKKTRLIIGIVLLIMGLFGITIKVDVLPHYIANGALIGAGITLIATTFVEMKN